MISNLRPIDTPTGSTGSRRDDRLTVAATVTSSAQRSVSAPGVGRPNAATATPGKTDTHHNQARRKGAEVALLRYANVVKKYQSGSEEIRAIDNLTLDIDVGEFVAVMGPSGCGKSTLLHLAGGIETVTAGDIIFDGRSVPSMSANELADLRRVDIGYVFQALNLIPSLTALENVSLPMELGGTSPRVARDEAVARLHQVGLDDSLGRYPSEFSGGQQQRIAIARALAGGRRLILADEPTGALDTATGDSVIELLATIASSGTAVVLVTHEPRFASWADRVAFLRDGRVVDQTAPFPQSNSGPGDASAEASVGTIDMADLEPPS